MILFNGCIILEKYPVDYHMLYIDFANPLLYKCPKPEDNFINLNSKCNDGEIRSHPSMIEWLSRHPLLKLYPPSLMVINKSINCMMRNLQTA